MLQLGQNHGITFPDLIADNGRSALMHQKKPIQESDWKRFRAIREIALDRFCRRTLESDKGGAH
jgi:hypothetical protein